MNNIIRIRACNEEGRTVKIYEVTNPIQVSVIANKFTYWEYIKWKSYSKQLKS